MDYRRFLQASDEVVVPVLAGQAWLADRCVRVDPAGAESGDRAGDGWWRVRARGRVADLLAPASTAETAAALARLPRVRGHALRAPGGIALVSAGAACQPVDLAPPAEEPPLFAPLTARRWPTGDLLLWEGLDWEGEAEEGARRALEEG